MKSEKAKMLAGETYDAGDAQLVARWHLTQKLVRQYNEADTEDQALLDSILSQLLGSKGKNLWIAAPFYVDYGENTHIGNNCEINMNCVFLDCNRISIGDNTGIGPNVQIYAVTHPVRAQERLFPRDSGASASWKESSAPVTIGENVWIGGGSIILSGVTIGSNTTIGAGSVVTRDIPSDCLAVGNPCRVVRRL